MRIALLHTAFEEAGGGERLAISMARALRELGHEVDLYTTFLDERAWPLIAGQDYPRPRPLRPSVTASLLRRIGGDRLARLRRLEAAASAARRLRRIGGYDVYIDTQSNVPLPLDACYIHYPAVLDYLEEMGVRPGLFRRLYNWAVGREARRLSSRPLLVLTNSAWTAAKVRGAYGLEAKVLHPPVNVESLLQLGDRKENIVLTVSRFTPEKNLEAVVRVAKMVPEAQFYMVGSTSSYSGPVLERVRSLIDGLRADNVHVETDVPRRRLDELYSTSKVYLHPPFPEHFGIAIAEGAAAGAVPVVYKDGGGWTDIASRVDPALGYTNVEEAASVVRSLLRDEARRASLANRAREVARGFSYEAFRENVRSAIEEVTRLKGLR